MLGRSLKAWRLRIACGGGVAVSTRGAAAWRPAHDGHAVACLDEALVPWGFRLFSASTPDRALAAVQSLTLGLGGLGLQLLGAGATSNECVAFLQSAVAVFI